LLQQKQGKPKTWLKSRRKINHNKMVKSNLNSIKKLSKKEQKAIVGGGCPNGTGPVVTCIGTNIRKCLALCP
jgi:hypothetical protein